MAVVPINPPCLQDPVGVSLVTRAPNVVDHPVLGPGLEGIPNLGRDLIQGLVPGNPLPTALPSGTDPLHRVEDPLRVVDLVDGCRALGAVPAPATRVMGVPLEFCDLPGFLVHVG